MSENICTGTYDDALESMRHLFEALLYGVKKPAPLLAVDASSLPSMPSATACHRTRRYAIVAGKLCRNHSVSLLPTRPPVMSDPKRLFKRQKRMVKTLSELSATMVA